jgi:hypothetical protein
MTQLNGLQAKKGSRQFMRQSSVQLKDYLEKLLLRRQENLVATTEKMVLNTDSNWTKTKAQELH